MGRLIGGASREELLAIALRLAREAGALLRRVNSSAGTRAELARVATRKTSGTDLATEADRASERLVIDRLSALRPADAILAEEGGSRPGSSGLIWIIDPLDGTTNFVYGFAPWAVSIAVAEDGGPTLAGVVHDPSRDETFSASLGGGATRDGRRLRLPNPPPLSESLIGTGFGYTPKRRAAQAALLPKVLPAVRDIRRAGSAALDLCYVACGRLDGYFEAGLQPWDRAAGLLIATEAGAKSAEIEDLVDGAAALVVGPGPLCDELCTLLLDAAQSRRS